MVPCRKRAGGRAPAVAVTACVVDSDAHSAQSAAPQLAEELRSYRQGLVQGSSAMPPAATPAVTPAVAASGSPVWNHCLRCEFQEGQLQTGLLQLALLSEADGTILAR